MLVEKSNRSKAPPHCDIHPMIDWHLPHTGWNWVKLKQHKCGGLLNKDSPALQGTAFGEIGWHHSNCCCRKHWKDEPSLEKLLRSCLNCWAACIKIIMFVFWKRLLTCPANALHSTGDWRHEERGTRTRVTTVFGLKSKIASTCHYLSSTW